MFAHTYLVVSCCILIQYVRAFTTSVPTYSLYIAHVPLYEVLHTRRSRQGGGGGGAPGRGQLTANGDSCFSRSTHYCVPTLVHQTCRPNSRPNSTKHDSTGLATYVPTSNVGSTCAGYHITRAGVPSARQDTSPTAPRPSSPCARSVSLPPSPRAQRVCVALAITCETLSSQVDQLCHKKLSLKTLGPKVMQQNVFWVSSAGLERRLV